MNFYGFKNMGVYDKEEHDKLLSKYPSIYHYTKIDAYRNILKIGSLWATKCVHFYNDNMETRLVIGLLKEIAKKLEEPFKRYTEATLSVVSLEMERIRDKIFAVCFSKDENSKRLWDNEGDHNHVSIEFDTLIIDKMLSLSKAELLNPTGDLYCNILFNEVYYNNEKLKKIITQFNNQFNNEQYKKEFYNEETENPTNIFELLAQLSVFAKEIRFTKESEIRVSFIPLIDEYKILENKRQCNNATYLDISFKTNNKLPIKSIRINPKYSDEYKNEVENLLKCYGYDIPIY